MILLLLSMVFAADGDEVGGFIMGQPLNTVGLECQGDVCQQKGVVAGQDGTFSVRLCDGVAKAVTFSVSFIRSTEETRAHFANNVQRVDDPRNDAIALWQFWHSALGSAGWATEDEGQDGGLPWARVANPPHARIVRVTEREANGHPVFTATLAAAASDASCSAP